MKKQISTIILPLCVVALMLTACSSTKPLSYFRDLNDTARVNQVDPFPYTPLALQTDDQLQITVSSINPELSQFFNMVTATPVASVAGANLSVPTQNMQSLYTVSAEGTITMPVLGDITVKGLTTTALRTKIKSLLVPYIKDAVVSVKLTNFKVTVIGEVAKPFIVPVNGEQINVLEAIGAAGDMNVYGQRFNVKIVRKNNEKLDIAHLNFNNSSTLKSPYFQLKQNDIVYVEPSKKKKVLGDNLNIWVPVLSSLVSMIVVIASNIK